MATTTTVGRTNQVSKKGLYWGIAIGVIVLAAIVWAVNMRNRATTTTTDTSVTAPADMTTGTTTDATSDTTAPGGYNDGTTASGESMQGGTGTVQEPGGYNNGTPNTDPAQPNTAPVQ